MRSWGDWLIESLFFFVYSVHVRIYVLFLFFVFIYSVHINHFFFLPYCKNLCTFFAFLGLPCAHQSFFSSILYESMYFLCFFFLFTVCTSIIFFFSIVRIYILSLFFLFPAYTSIIFLFYKNLCIFFLFLFTACTLE